MSELLASPTAGFAMFGTLAVILGGLYTRHIKLTTRTLIDIALMLALTIVLHQIRIFHMPQGGSVTLGAMVPLLLLSYRYGPGIGALAGFLYGLINIIQDPFIVHPVQVLFDYPLPYMAMGLAGLWRGHLYRGIALAFLARFLCHVISGVVFFASYAPEGMNPLVYSLAFNATYLIPEFLICCLILRLLPVKRLLAAMGQSR